MKKNHFPAAAAVFIFCAAIVAVIIIREPFSGRESRQQYHTRVIVPGAPDDPEGVSSQAEYMAIEENYTLKMPLDEGEISIAMLNYDFDNNAVEDQVVAYRSVSSAGSPVSLTLIAWDESSESYRRLWSETTAAVMQGTVTMNIQDVIGDRSVCIVVTGMNAQSEHTMTIFHKKTDGENDNSFNKIAELRMDGLITIQETERPLAYRQGIGKGQPFIISAYGRDPESGNLLDRMEISHVYNTTKGIYERNTVTRVPGSQIEQRRVRELLSGGPKVFESFINDLWYYTGPEGTIDKSQYLYFDPPKKEIIFFGDETQQVFTWQNSTSTRYGLYISSQNISVTTLRRFLDIELESLDSIRIRVREDIKLKIGVSASWDGLYRRAGTAVMASGRDDMFSPFTDAVYDSSMGRFLFSMNGKYELNAAGVVSTGRYAFFKAGGRELLEMRQNGQQPAGQTESSNRRVFTVTMLGGTEGNPLDAGNIGLSRVRIGSSGIQELNENQIILTRAHEGAVR